MKRTATTLVLLAGLGGGGCVSSDSQAYKGQPTTHTGGFGTVTRGKEVNTVQGPLGEPVMAVRGAAPGGVTHAGGANTLMGHQNFIRPVAGFAAADGCTNCVVPGVGGSVVRASGPGYGPPQGAFGPGGPPPGAFGPGGPPMYPYGPQMPDMPQYGILPVPAQGVPGATAAFGALMPGMHGGVMGRPSPFTGRTSINFTGPAGMKVTWQLADGSFTDDEKGGLTAPTKYNFVQGQVYRLRLSRILPDFPTTVFYPTLEVAPVSPKTLTFLSHSSVPITFSADDFAQAKAGNLVVKVVYLPDPANQDFSTVVGAEEVVSTRLEPGADPVAEAQRRGTILAVIRMGNIDLENPFSPKMTAPPPGALPPGAPPVGNPLPQPKPQLPSTTGIPVAPDSLPPLGPTGPAAPINPPGTATVKPPVALPALPSAPTNLPIEPMAPIAPSPKPVK